jgi:phosphatidylglycerophosphatase A
MNMQDTNDIRAETSILLDARHVALGTPDGFLAFGFGSGLLTRAPGTMGTLVAVPFAYWLHLLDGATMAWILIGAFVAGVWLCQRVAERLGVGDYGGIVWDEIVGYCVAAAWIPNHWAWFLAAFALFRFFDIVKPWPISALETRFDGGFGIMVDDVLAGVYTAILLAGLEAVFWAG